MTIATSPIPMRHVLPAFWSSAGIRIFFAFGMDGLSFFVANIIICIRIRAWAESVQKQKQRTGRPERAEPRKPKKLGLIPAMVSRHLATAAARLPSVAASNLPRFPPQQSLYEKSDIPKPAFDSEAWAAAQPPPPSALIAFAHRLGLSTVMSTPETVQMTCTHTSFIHLHRRVYPDAPRPVTNDQLSTLGNALMGMFASEFVHAAYPYLPTKVWKVAVAAYVGSLTCATIAREMGATPLLRWHRIVCRCSRISYIGNFFFVSLAKGRLAPRYHAR